jgi:hypothetical protein
VGDGVASWWAETLNDGGRSCIWWWVGEEGWKSLRGEREGKKAGW